MGNFDSRVSIFKLTDSGGIMRDISTNIYNMTGLPGTSKLNDVTTFGSVGDRWGRGIQTNTINLDVIYNEDADIGSDTVFGDLFTDTTARAFEYYPSGVGTGHTKYNGDCFLENYDIAGKMGSHIIAKVVLKADNGVTRGTASGTSRIFYSTTADGYAFLSDADYATARTTANAATVDNTSTTMGILHVYSSGLTDYEIARGFLYFDTSSLSGLTVISAELKLFYSGFGENNVDNELIQIQYDAGNTYPHIPLVVGDYDESQYTGSGGAVLIAATNLSIPLNTAGIAMLNLTGTTKLCLRTTGDINGVTPNGFNSYFCYTAEAGSGLKPMLTVVYT
jgi:hypothetical protein